MARPTLDDSALFMVDSLLLIKSVMAAVTASVVTGGTGLR
jgi:hypothetical protein